MRHAGIEDRARVTQLAFDLVWQPKGWHLDDNQEDS